MFTERTTTGLGCINQADYMHKSDLVSDHAPKKMEQIIESIVENNCDLDRIVRRLYEMRSRLADDGSINGSDDKGKGNGSKSGYIPTFDVVIGATQNYISSIFGLLSDIEQVI